MSFNPCHIQFISGNIKIYAHVLSFLNTVMVQVVEILPQGRHKPIYPTKTIQWPLMRLATRGAWSSSDIWVKVCLEQSCLAPGGRFKNAYELLTLRALKFSHVNKIHIFQCMGKIFCMEFQRYPLKFHTKYLTHTLKDMIFMQFWNFKSS